MDDLHKEVTRLVNSKQFEEVEEIWPSEISPMVSIAISLKRIADTLDGTAAGMNIYETVFGRTIP